MSRIYISEDKKTIVVWQEDAMPVLLTLIEDDEAPPLSAMKKVAALKKYEPTEKQKKSGYKCSKCHLHGHSAKTCNRRKPVDKDEADGLELIDKVAELKAKGMSSGDVAKELGITLADVNDLW